jgi:hypothetical protein
MLHMTHIILFNSGLAQTKRQCDQRTRIKYLLINHLQKHKESMLRNILIFSVGNCICECKNEMLILTVKHEKSRPYKRSGFIAAAQTYLTLVRNERY